MLAAVMQDDVLPAGSTAENTSVSSTRPTIARE